MILSTIFKSSSVSGVLMLWSSSYRIPYDGVLTIGTPDPGLASAYEAKVEQAKEIEDNRNAELQQPAVQEVLNTTEISTTGVGADTEQHPIAEPFEQA